jgi:gas vesicle protein
MITVNILINGQCLFARSAVRIKGTPGKICRYSLDTGGEIEHHYDLGAVPLAIKMLETIRESTIKQQRAHGQEVIEQLSEMINESRERVEQAMKDEKKADESS